MIFLALYYTLGLALTLLSLYRANELKNSVNIATFAIMPFISPLVYLYSYYCKIKSLFTKDTPPPLPEKHVELNLDTGKITLPDDLTAEEKAAVKELQEKFQSLVPTDLFENLEHFLKETESPLLPFIKANHLENAQSQVMEELENCKTDTEHWKDEDFIEALYGYYMKKYKFPGIEAIADKYDRNVELSKEEKQKLRDWYMLVSQEHVICE